MPITWLSIVPARFVAVPPEVLVKSPKGLTSPTVRDVAIVSPVVCETVYENDSPSVN